MGRNSDAFGAGRPRRADVVVAAVFTVVTVVNLVGETVYGGSELVWDARGTWWAVMVTVVAVALAWRRRRPLVPVLVAFVAVSTTDAPRGSLLIFVFIAIWCVIIASAVLHGSRTLLAVVAAGAIAVVGLTLGSTVDWGRALGIAGIMAVPSAVGAAERWARCRRRRRELAVQRRDWAEERRAVEQERVRMARELHDVVAHHVSGIVVAGGAAMRVLDRDPDTVRETLRTIAESAARTSDAMHRMITHGEDGADVARDGGPDAAQPGLPGLPDLVERFTRTGCSVELSTTGDLSTVPPDASLSVYRIVQECLTNSLRHAGPVPVTVRVQRAADSVVVRVDDTGPRADVPLAPMRGTGQGLVGMTERVAIFGGTLVHGPRLGGGWSVHASLPLGRPAAG